MERGGYNPELEAEMKKISGEGWEGDEESGAALLIGKKEDMEKMREKLETEGKTQDVATFIRMHKEIILPASEKGRLPSESRIARLDAGEFKGQQFISLDYRYDKESVPLYFVDRDGNFCKVNIKYDDIAEIKDSIAERGGSPYNFLQSKLAELHFTPMSENDYGEFSHATKSYWRDQATKAKEKGKDEFDF